MTSLVILHMGKEQPGTVAYGTLLVRGRGFSVITSNFASSVEQFQKDVSVLSSEDLDALSNYLEQHQMGKDKLLHCFMIHQFILVNIGPHSRSPSSRAYFKLRNEADNLEQARRDAQYQADEMAEEARIISEYEAISGPHDEFYQQDADTIAHYMSKQQQRQPDGSTLTIYDTIVPLYMRCLTDPSHPSRSHLVSLLKAPTTRSTIPLKPGLYQDVQVAIERNMLPRFLIRHFLTSSERLECAF